MSGGHKVEGCDGKWITVGTLVDPDLQMCAVCRGTRSSKLGEVEEFNPDAMDARQRLDSQGVPFGIFLLLLGVLVGVVVAVIGAALWLSLR